MCFEKTLSRLGEHLPGELEVLMTGATTGIVYLVGKSAKASGVFHVGVPPATSQSEHVERHQSPTDACDLDRLHRLWFEGEECSAGGVRARS